MMGKPRYMMRGFNASGNAPRASLLAHPAIRYTLAALIVLNGNTIPGHLGKMMIITGSLTVLVCSLITILAWREYPVGSAAIKCSICWSAIVFITSILPMLLRGDVSGGPFLAFVLFSFLPLMLYLLGCMELLDSYLEAFVNLVASLGMVSLTIWILGPMFGLLTPNCAIQSTWSGSGDLRMVDGYFFLQFIPQGIDALGVRIIRNTGIFTEGPMYSYMLCCALLVECYFRKNVRKIIIGIISVVVVSTFSTTGIVFVIGFILIELIKRFASSDERCWRAKKHVKVVLLLGLILIGLLIAAKLRTMSGSVRLDDFVAGYKAWISSPIFGHGFSNWSIVQEYMSPFRASETGFSNSLFNILVTGGIMMATPCVMSFIGFALLPKDQRLVLLMYLFLWMTTIVSYLSVTIFIMSLGVSGFYHWKTLEGKNG